VKKILQAQAQHSISAALLSIGILSCVTFAVAQQPTFRNAPAAAAADKNPYASSSTAAAAGKKLYARYCTQCHGNNLQGMGPAPALDTPQVRKAKAGELFWFITTGKMTSGMPGWSQLSKQERWQIVTFLQSPAAQSADAK
jgi:mono/diheme cytochrome c family protein